MESLPINLTDLVIVAVILISGAWAFMRGFVHELLAVAAWVGAAVVTVSGLRFVQPYARELISVQIIADIVAGVGLFVFVLVLLSIITHWLARRVRESSLGAVDRSLGLLYGFARGAFFVCVAWIALLLFLPREDHPVWITEARALPLVEEGAHVLVDLLPEDLRPDLSGTAESPIPSIEELSKPGVGPESEPAAQEAGPPEPSGYKDDERKDLQRLIESAQ